MRVYVPNKEHGVLKEVLKELYLLRQAIDFGSGTVDSKLSQVDKIRGLLQSILDQE